MSRSSIRVLLVEDDEDDYITARDLFHEIDGAEYDLDWVRAYDEALEMIERNEHHVYLLDFHLGERTGLELLQEAVARGCRSPIIFMTGQGDKQVDMEAMKAGAEDYLMKGHIDAHILERSIRYALERKRSEAERERLIQELQNALAQVKTLSGLLPICASCKKIRDDKGYWNQIEGYIEKHSDAVFSHGICPECANKLYPNYLKKK
jgi:FixJ family two-component response regulator